MLKKGNVVLNIVVVVVVALLGFSAGYLAGRNFQPAVGISSKPVPNLNPVGAANKVVKSTMQTVSGQIAEISSDSITLADGGDTLTFKVGPEIKPVKLLPPPVPSGKEATSGGAVPQPGKEEELKLADLKVGDSVTASVFLKPEGLVAISLALTPKESLPK